LRRIQLFEIEDQTWCPRFLRMLMTDYLEFATGVTRPYEAVIPRLARVLRENGSTRVVDLGSGGGGPWPRLIERMAKEGVPLEVCLTDRYPDREAFERARVASGGRISYHPRPVDAARVPGELSGFRTLFAAFHHFRPAKARAVLADAVGKGQGIAVIEATQRNAGFLVLACLTPLMVLLFTPFIRPFSWSRLLWTYVLPIVPPAVLFDGLVSCLRTYTPEELRNLAQTVAGAEGYVWEIGEDRAPRAPEPVTYLIGYPRNG
jgi:hypothetical protein